MRPRFSLDALAPSVADSLFRARYSLIPWLFNFLLPGTGLILVRREWLGFLLALVFGICGNVALAGWFIAPAAVPIWLTRIAGAMTVLAWLASQMLLKRQTARSRANPGEHAALEC